MENKRRIEFGSDFHACSYPAREWLAWSVEWKNLYASGRQALQHLVATVGQLEGWKRLWVPAYYCGESLEYVKGIEIARYPLLPSETPRFERLNEVCRFREGDVLMLVNFFGMHKGVDVSEWDVTVIEDHTHDIASDWARSSSAEWCFASLRKQLPVADGGVLWSPVGNACPAMPAMEAEAAYAAVANRRNEAMQLKGRYLAGENVDKSEFLSLFSETEEAFASLPISAPCEATLTTIRQLDIHAWRELKARNLEYIKTLLSLAKCEIVDSATFSLLLKFPCKEARDAARRELIAKCVYGAVLWPDVYGSHDGSPERQWADCMLSLHVDGRYTLEDMAVLAEILNKTV